MVDAVRQQIIILYRYNHNSESTYEISVKGVTDTNCTVTSNVADNNNDSEERNSNSHPDGEYVDYDDGKIAEKDDNLEMSPVENSAQDVDESGQEKGYADENAQQMESIEVQNLERQTKHVASLKAARLLPRTLRYDDHKPRRNWENCSHGKGCPKVLYAPPDPHDFKPVNNELISKREIFYGTK